MKLIKVYSKTCGPCKALERNLQKSNVKYESVDIATDEGQDFIEKHNVQNIPMLLLFDDNDHIIKRAHGVKTIDEIKEFINV